MKSLTGGQATLLKINEENEKKLQKGLTGQEIYAKEVTKLRTKVN